MYLSPTYSYGKISQCGIGRKSGIEMLPTLPQVDCTQKTLPATCCHSHHRQYHTIHCITIIRVMISPVRETMQHFVSHGVLSTVWYENKSTWPSPISDAITQHHPSLWLDGDKHIWNEILCDFYRTQRWALENERGEQHNAGFGQVRDLLRIDWK